MNHDQIDHVVAALSRTVPNGALIGVGLGTPTALVAGMVATRLRGGHVLAGGAFDVEPPVDRWMAGPDAVAGHATGYVSHFQSMEWAESQRMTMQFLRPAQVDGHGNLNTSRLGPVDSPQRRFPGGLATGDVPQLLSRVVVYLPRHLPRNTPATVSYRTAGGAPSATHGFHSEGVAALVTDLAVIEFGPAGAIIKSFHPWTTVQQIIEHTEFPLGTAEAVPTPEPSQEELAALRYIDPNRLRDGELGRAA